MQKMLLNVTESLPNLVRAKYKEAKASDALIFSATEVDVVCTSTGIPFQLRYCPSLAKKPEPLKDKKNDDEVPKKKKFDPFDNPSPSLFITDVPGNTAAQPSHLLVLNKFPVIQNHFILATKENKPQTHRLEQDDLEATYACLKAWEHDEEDGNQKTDSSTTPKPNRERRLFAFFNSGAHSGASQPHRHVQFLPVEDMREQKTPNQKEGTTWDLLVDTILSDGVPLPLTSPTTTTTTTTIEPVLHHPSLPFLHFAQKFPSSPSGPHLLHTYTHLLDLASSAMQNLIPSSSPARAETAEVPFSYNLAMTTAGMAILPRRSEGATLLAHDDNETEVGYVQLNGTALGGTLLVKREREWDVLRTRGGVLDGVLEKIGVPRGDGVGTASSSL